MPTRLTHPPFAIHPASADGCVIRAPGCSSIARPPRQRLPSSLVIESASASTDPPARSSWAEGAPPMNASDQCGVIGRQIRTHRLTGITVAPASTRSTQATHSRRRVARPGPRDCLPAESPRHQTIVMRVEIAFAGAGVSWRTCSRVPPPDSLRTCMSCARSSPNRMSATFCS